MLRKKCVLQENVEYGSSGGGLFVKVRFKNKYIVSNTVSVIYVTFRPNAGRYRIATNPNGVPIKFNDIINDANNKVFKVFQDHPILNSGSLVHGYANISKN